MGRLHAAPADHERLKILGVWLFVDQARPIDGVTYDVPFTADSCL